MTQQVDLDKLVEIFPNIKLSQVIAVTRLFGYTLAPEQPIVVDQTAMDLLFTPPDGYMKPVRDTPA